MRSALIALAMVACNRDTPRAAEHIYTYEVGHMPADVNEKMKVHGRVSPNWLKVVEGGRDLTLLGEHDEGLRVHYRGPVPDNLVPGADCVATGHLTVEEMNVLVLQATEIVVTTK